MLCGFRTTCSQSHPQHQPDPTAAVPAAQTQENLMKNRLSWLAQGMDEAVGVGELLLCFRFPFSHAVPSPCPHRRLPTATLNHCWYVYCVFSTHERQRKGEFKGCLIETKSKCPHSILVAHMHTKQHLLLTHHAHSTCPALCSCPFMPSFDSMKAEKRSFF